MNRMRGHDKAQSRSGHGRNVVDGIQELRALSAGQPSSSDNQVAILPGSGIHGEMLPDFLSHLPNIMEIHLSASEAIDEEVDWSGDRGKELGFGSGKVWRLNREKLKSAFQAIVDLQDA